MPCAVNHTHPAAPDLFEDFVIAKSPLRVWHVRLLKHALENLRGSFALSSQSFVEKTTHAEPLAETSSSAALLTFSCTLHHARD